MSFRTAGIALFAVLGLAANAGSAGAQQTVETYSNFRWTDITPAVCLANARAAINGAISGYGLGGLTTGDDTWYVQAGGDDLNLWVYCIADDDTAAVDGPAAKRVLVVVNVNSGRPSLGGAVRDFLAQCMETACPAVTTPVATTDRLNWIDNASQFRGSNGKKYTFICPALGDETPGAVWGVEIYTDDSSICAAAVHAGVIGTSGGSVTIEIAPGEASYQGMVRNGIASNPWDSFLGSFRLVSGR